MPLGDYLRNAFNQLSRGYEFQQAKKGGVYDELRDRAQAAQQQQLAQQRAAASEREAETFEQQKTLFPGQAEAQQIQLGGLRRGAQLQGLESPEQEMERIKAERDIARRLGEAGISEKEADAAYKRQLPGLMRDRVGGTGVRKVRRMNEAGEMVEVYLPVGEATGIEQPLVPTTDARNRGAAYKRAKPIISAIGDLSSRINVNQGIVATAKGEAAKLAAQANLNDDVAEYEALIAGFTPLVARSLGHTGVLTEQDVQSTRMIFPAPRDSKSLRDRKIKRLDSLLSEIESAGLTNELAEASEIVPPSTVNPYSSAIAAERTRRGIR